jgi:hypothetical protein
MGATECSAIHQLVDDDAFKNSQKNVSHFNILVSHSRSKYIGNLK